MRYYKLMMDYNGTKEEDMVCYVEKGFTERYGIDEYVLYEGKFIELWNENLTFYYNPSEGSIPNDYLATDLAWLIVSKRCKNILEEMNISNVQYLPIRIENIYDASEIEGFYAVNIIGQTKALNLYASDYSYFVLDDEKILNVRKYGVNKDVVKDHHIFRLQEDTIPTFVSEEIKNAFNKNELNGFDFLEIRVE